MKENLANKSSHEGLEQVELWQPIIKSSTGKYLAVLSDTSVDRDNEIVGKSALQKIMVDDGYVVGLIDHEHKVMNQVCEWVNKRLEVVDGHHAFIAEPKFYESNPNAKILKGMLDEGAKFGISIGAIVKDCKQEKIGGETYKVYTDLELLEASFVAIPSNRHGRVMAVAKSFNNKLEEQNKMDAKKTYSEKEFDAEVVKASDLSKQVESLNKELEELKVDNEKVSEDLSEANEKKEEAEAKVEEAENKVEEAEKKVEESTAELKKLGEMHVLKGDHATVEEAGDDMAKKLESNELPVFRR